MSAFDDFDEKLKKYREKLPEFMEAKHKNAPPELRDLLSAVAAVGFQYLPHVMAQGGAAGVSAIRLAFEVSKVFD